MEKELKDITREDFKHNFLTRSLLRVDYKGVIEIEDTINKLKKELKQKGFETLEIDFINEMEFELLDPEMISNQGLIPVKEFNSTKTYKFLTANGNQVLEVNKFFASLMIKTDNYSSFTNYIEKFVDTFKIINENNDFLTPIRLGVRKYNESIIPQSENINFFFNDKLFPETVDVLQGQGFLTRRVSSDFIDTLYKDEYFYNYNRGASYGTINGNKFLGNKDSEVEVYQLFWDIDGYTSNSNDLKILAGDSERLKQSLCLINDELFELYKFSLNEEFAQELLKDEFELASKIYGVKKNGL